MRKYLFIALFFFTRIAASQNMYFTLEGNYSTFQMSDLKSIQQDLAKQSGLQLITVDQFPSYFGYGAIAAFDYSRFSFGLHGGFTSTGARSDYEDYSGLARVEQLAKCFWFGPYFQVRFGGNSSWKPFFNFRASYLHTDLSLNRLLELGSSQYSTSNSFNSWNTGLRPEFGVRRDFKRIFFQASIGYEFQIHGKLYLNSNHSDYLQTSNGSQAHAQWDGLRASAGVGFYILKTKQ